MWRRLLVCRVGTHADTFAPRLRASASLLLASIGVNRPEIDAICVGRRNAVHKLYHGDGLGAQFSRAAFLQDPWGQERSSGPPS